MPKNIAIITITITAIVLIVLGGAAYIGLRQAPDQERAGQGGEVVKEEQPVTLEPEEPTVTEPIDTSVWKVYRSKLMRFEIEYPRNWKLREDSLNVELSNEFSKDSKKTGCSFKISMVPPQFIKGSLELHKYAGLDWQSQEIQVNEIPTTKITYPKFPTSAVYFLKRPLGEQSIYYRVSVDVFRTEEQVFGIECLGMFDHMLSSFKFIE